MKVKARLAPSHIRERREKLFKNPTRAESLMLDFIPILNERYNLGLTFQQILKHQQGFVIADFYSWPARIAFELDGRHHHEDRIQCARDRERDQLLEMAEVTVIRFPNQQVLDDVFSVAMEMVHACLSQMGREKELIGRQELEDLYERHICERFGLPLTLV